MKKEDRQVPAGFEAPLGWTFHPDKQGPKFGAICWATDEGYLSVNHNDKGVHLTAVEYGRIYPLSRNEQSAIWSSDQIELRLPLRELAHRMLFCNLQPGYDPQALVPRLIAAVSVFKVFSIDGVLEWTLEMPPIEKNVFSRWVAMFMPSRQN